jgi:putative nucleotidyltransferase with HDIG domain
VALNRTPRVLLQRAIALALIVVLIPVMVALASVSEAAPVREGEPSPRPVIATEVINLIDIEATDLARSTASESVRPVLVFDDEGAANLVAAVRSVFDIVQDARRPVEVPQPPSSPSVAEDGTVTEPPTTVLATPTREEQLVALRNQILTLGDDALLSLIDLDTIELNALESEALSIAQGLARQRISADDLDQVVADELRVEMSVRTFPGDLGEVVVRPLIRAVMQPTVTIDPAATAAARERASAAIPDVVRTWRVGETIVRSGEVVTPIQAQALRSLGLEGTDAREAIGRAVLAMLVVVLVGLFFLRTMQPAVWGSGRKPLLIASLLIGFAGLAVGIDLLAEEAVRAWWYLAPGGALAMLASLLVTPIVGFALLVPAVVIILLLAPGETAGAVFVVAIIMSSVPLVSELSSRGDLRAATLRAMLTYPFVAVAIEIVFAGGEEPVIAFLAGLGNGALTAMLVQGALPFLESTFRLPTVTALLDLADRNHPLLRELESKALGSYNHSVMVASLVERACREIGANPLIGSVAALYHDIGKVRQPHFFIENQQGIANPHDDLEPEISAVIIQNHVVDGVEMAREYRLPPEVVSAIGSHHGTMLVSYFYNRARTRAPEGTEVDEQLFRYKGNKPRRKEAAVLFIADSAEAATRAAAMKRGTLPREEIERTVDKLIQERLDDHQFENTDLTFHELTTVRNSIVEALVGIYHPRIDYPDGELPARASLPASSAAPRLARSQTHERGEPHAR